MSLNDFMRAGEQTAGINNLVLFYNGHYKNNAGIWTTEQFLPYVSYLDEQGKAKDWFYDGCLFLAKWSHRFHGYEESENPNDLEDWIWYLDKTFGDGGDLSKLNQAVTLAGEQLGDQDTKMKVVIMIPYPDPRQKAFGVLDGAGSLCFSPELVSPEEAHANKQQAVRWYVDQVWERWQENAAQYSRLELSALYWMNEAVRAAVPFENDLVRYTGDLVHDKGLKYFFIPWFKAEQYEKWEELGFDAAILQPNHFFGDSEASRIEETAHLARKAGMGVEIEVDPRAFQNPKFEQKYIDYLNGAVDFGYEKDVFKGYYQDVKFLEMASRSSDPEQRKFYDWTFEFVKGTYTKK